MNTSHPILVLRRARGYIVVAQRDLFEEPLDGEIPDLSADTHITAHAAMTEAARWLMLAGEPFERQRAPTATSGANASGSGPVFEFRQSQKHANGSIWTQRDMATALACTPTMIHRYESEGKAPPPNGKIGRRFAQLQNSQ